MILAGDIGGTNSRFALFEGRGRELSVVWKKTWPSRESGEFSELVQHALQESGGRPSAASFGVAGPVREGRVQATNLPWTIDGAQLARQLGLERVGLINDLEANAWGLEMLAPDD